jgi:hypothetical protein
MIASLIGGLILLLVWVIGGVISLACFVFWLWMLVHAVTNKGISDVEKIMWVLVVILLPFIGSVIYFFVGKPKAI